MRSILIALFVVGLMLCLSSNAQAGIFGRNRAVQKNVSISRGAVQKNVAINRNVGNGHRNNDAVNAAFRAGVRAGAARANHNFGASAFFGFGH